MILENDNAGQIQQQTFMVDSSGNQHYRSTNHKGLICMFDKKEWSKAYYEKNKEKINQYGKEWYEKNKEKCFQYKKEWEAKNKNKRKEYTKRDWLKHKKRRLELRKEKGWKTEIAYNKRFKQKFPEKYRARKYAERHKQRDTNCFICNSTNDLHFHHIDYEKKEGITLCRRCHNGIHRKS